MFEKLRALHAQTQDRAIISLFDDPARVDHFALDALGMLFDYSKTNIDEATKSALLDLIETRAVADCRDAMFQGAPINETEGRAVLHTALRQGRDARVYVDGKNVMPEVHETLDRMRDFASAVRDARFAGEGGMIENVVNIGIGGSDLGPAMAVRALSPYHDGPRVHFISNVDGADVQDCLRGLDPATTLVIVASKTFTTIETMTNAQTALDWMGQSVEDPAAQFVALSSAMDKTAEFGIAPERVFGFADWVGGRYSVWGPIGLSLMIAIGPDQFDAFLRGAREMDAHFQSAPADRNMPILLALVGLYHHQICGYGTRAVLPYDQRLARLPAYLQQLEMESNGKSVQMNGTAVDQAAGPIVWGEPGTNGQHAFYQLIHQGAQVVPCEFMIAAQSHEPHLAHHHQLLKANCLAQSEALMRGRSLEEARAIVAAKGIEASDQERQARHRVFAGNRPSTTLAYEKLTPDTLGKIIALYEHRVFVEGVIMGINSFDQWGVELGKELANTLTPVLQGHGDASGLSPSAARLIRFLS